MTLLLAPETATFELLMHDNERFSEAFSRSRLMKLVQGNDLDESAVRERFLDGIQVFSDAFQNTMLLRASFTANPRFLGIAREHLNEEFGHNADLLKDRDQRVPSFDAVLDATTSWFAHQMLTLDDLERLVLVHLVLETSANIFFPEANRAMQRYSRTHYFAVHAEVDEHHRAMGMSLLGGLRAVEYQRLLDVHERGWQMLLTVCDRIAELSLGGG
jgi:hypothetical protein